MKKKGHTLIVIVEKKAPIRSSPVSDLISIPSFLTGFEQNIEEIRSVIVRSGRRNHILPGEYPLQSEHRVCPNCGGIGHVHDSRETSLLHLPFGNELTTLMFPRTRLLCRNCGTTWMQNVPFKAEKHFITSQLEEFTYDLLEQGLTLKKVSELTGLGRNTVKEIDKRRLEGKFTFVNKEGKRQLSRPERQTKAIAVDEFKLHDGHVYATIVIDIETGHILWLAHGKKKQALLDFIEHAGRDWFDTVQAVACDMNSDYQEVFESEFRHIKVVYDHFHIVKYFNDKVISGIRKDEMARLRSEGKEDEAKALKGSRYILWASRKTLEEKDRAAEEGKIVVHEGKLFPRMEKVAKGGWQERYRQLLEENTLFSTADIVKEALDLAYKSRNEKEMSDLVRNIMEICRSTENKHFISFAKLLEDHFDGIISHATLAYSSGKIEGINNMIKTIRRQAYGYRDDEYFFLKLFDASRRDKAINPKSHRKSD